MNPVPLALAAALVGFLLGASINHSNATPAPTSTGTHAAYLIAGWNILQPERSRPFGDAVVPLARRAGFQPLAAAPAQVLEGQWPYSGIVILQKYDSMQALQEFWFSPEHTEVKKLRDGLIDSHFVVAVEAQN